MKIGFIISSILVLLTTEIERLHEVGRMKINEIERYRKRAQDAES